MSLDEAAALMQSWPADPNGSTMQQPKLDDLVPSVTLTAAELSTAHYQLSVDALRSQSDGGTST